MQQTVLRDTIDGYQKEPEAHNRPLQRRRGIEGGHHPPAQTQLAGARKRRVPDLRVARAQFEHAIATLTGPAAQRHLDVSASRIDGPPPPVPLTVPSQLLERRPDIAASERQVAAANSNVGLAETAYYPTLTLSADLGLITTNLANLFSYASRSWSAGPTVSQTVLDFGRRRAQLEVSPGRLRPQPSPLYRETVLSAFQEVSRTIWRVCATWRKRQRSSSRPSRPPNRPWASRSIGTRRGRTRIST